VEAEAEAEGVAEGLAPDKRVGKSDAGGVPLLLPLGVGEADNVGKGLAPGEWDGVGLPEGEREVGAAPLGEGAWLGVPLSEAVADAEAPLDCVALGVPVPVSVEVGVAEPRGVAGGTGGALAVGVVLSDTEVELVREPAAPPLTLPVLLALAPTEMEAVGVTLTVELPLTVEECVIEEVPVPEPEAPAVREGGGVPLTVTVGVPVPVWLSAPLPLSEAEPMLEADAPTGAGVTPGVADTEKGIAPLIATLSTRSVELVAL